MISDLSKNDNQTSQNAAAQPELTNGTPKRIEVVKDFHRHASDFVNPDKTYQIYIHDETDGDTYRVLEAGDEVAIRLALPEQVSARTLTRDAYFVYNGTYMAHTCYCIEGNYSPTGFASLGAIGGRDHQRGDFIWKFKEVAKKWATSTCYFKCQISYNT